MTRGFERKTEEFKLQVIEDVLRGKLSKEEARRKYNIKGKSAILKWMRKFGLEEYKTLPANFAAMKKDGDLSKEELLKRIKLLERQLQDEQIKSFGYSRMIDLAEEQLKIKIRKNFNTKQSEK